MKMYSRNDNLMLESDQTFDIQGQTFISKNKKAENTPTHNNENKINKNQLHIGQII